MMAGALVLSACAGIEGGVTEIGGVGCKRISEQAMAKINWARVPRVEMAVREGDFEPMVLRMKQGRPYVLKIRNRDDSVRYFRALEFFKQNAVIAIAVDGERAEETCVQAVNIPPRKTAEVRFVAVIDGHYEFEDNFLMIPLVMSGGPSGVIVIEERKEVAAGG